MGLYDQALVRAYSGGSNWLEDLIKAKAHVKAHFRKDPKSGKLIYIKEHEKEFDPHVVFAQGDKVKILHGDHAGKEMTVNGYSEEKHVLRLKHPDHPNVSIAPHRVEHSEKTHENTPGEVKKPKVKEGDTNEVKEVKRVEAAPYNFILYSDGSVKISSHGMFKENPSDDLIAEAKEALGLTKQTDKQDASKGYVQTGGQGGSNPGGQFKGPDGKTYYMKFYKNPDQGRSEVLANLVTDQFGLTSPKATIKKIELNGQVKEAMATEWMGGLTFIKNVKHDITSLPPGEQEQLAKHFLSSVLVGDRDVVGLVYDNLARTKDGNWICIDRGGSFKFRAQGGPKEYGANPIEFEGLTNPSINAQSSSIFNPILDNTVAKDPAKYISWLKGLLSADIDKAVKKARLGQDIANTMAVRRDKLIEKIKAKYGNGGANELKQIRGAND